MHVEHTSLEVCPGCHNQKSQLQGVGTQRLHWSALCVVQECPPYSLHIVALPIIYLFGLLCIVEMCC